MYASGCVVGALVAQCFPFRDFVLIYPCPCEKRALSCLAYATKKLMVRVRPLFTSYDLIPWHVVDHVPITQHLHCKKLFAQFFANDIRIHGLSIPAEHGHESSGKARLRRSFVVGEWSSEW